MLIFRVESFIANLVEKGERALSRKLCTTLLVLLASLPYLHLPLHLCIKLLHVLLLNLYQPLATSSRIAYKFSGFLYIPVDEQVVSEHYR